MAIEFLSCHYSEHVCLKNAIHCTGHCVDKAELKDVSRVGEVLNPYITFLQKVIPIFSYQKVARKKIRSDHTRPKLDLHHKRIKLTTLVGSQWQQQTIQLLSIASRSQSSPYQRHFYSGRNADGSLLQAA